MSTIAVLIPSYKPAEYIEKCLESLEFQTLAKQNFIVYIALNGPKDHYQDYLLEILSKFSFQYKYYYLAESGVSKARNFLIENSVEPYITFIDDDDRVSERYLESLLAVVRENIMAISNIYNFEQIIEECKPNYIGQSFLELSDMEQSKFKSRKYFSSPCAKLLHRTMISSLRFDPKLSIGEDSLFMAQISKNIDAVKKADINACYYVYERSGSATRKKIDKKYEIKRVIYLVYQYGKMLFSFKYEKAFILSRIVATILHLKKIFR